MQKGYFAAVWADLTKSPGWVSKLARLSLLMFVPILGAAVMYGYLYGWAREIAWNVHRPLPERILGDEDGTLYRRGFSIFCLGLVCALVPYAFSGIGSLLSSTAFNESSIAGAVATPAIGTLLLGFGFNVVSFAFAFVCTAFFWVGSMRIAVYNTLSSGFQLGKIWAMIRYDLVGLLRILGMMCLMLLVYSAIAAVLGAILFFMGAAVIFAIASGMVFDLAATVITLILACALVFAAFFGSVLIGACVCRALGYWTRQFEVRLWGGQEDPLPFERRI